MTKPSAKDLTDILTIVLKAEEEIEDEILKLTTKLILASDSLTDKVEKEMEAPSKFLTKEVKEKEPTKRKLPKKKMTSFEFVKGSISKLKRGVRKWNDLVLGAVNDTVPKLLPSLTPENEFLEDDKKKPDLFKQMTKKEAEKIAKDGTKRFLNITKTNLTQRFRRGRNIVRDSIRQNTTERITINRLKQSAGFTEGQATRFARTGTMSMINAGLDQIYEDNEDVIEGVRHVSVLDSKTCIVCGSLDGKVYFKTTSKKGQVADPDEASYEDRPPLPIHASCRCVYVPISKFWARASKILGRKIGPSGMRASLLKKPVLDWNGWLKEKNKENPDTVKGILGLKRYALWMKGVPPEVFVSVKLEVKPLKQVVEELLDEDFITAATAASILDEDKPEND